MKAIGKRKQQALNRQLCMFRDCLADAIQQFVPQIRFFHDQNRNRRGSIAHMFGRSACDENSRTGNSPTAQCFRC